MAAQSSDSSLAIGSYSDGPPWIFKGRAVYQLHAVKSSIARRFIPQELKLVEAFGYTLGGLFLAHYDGSPAGEFDEAVVIAGIVWNPPTSCAWAGRVLVGKEEARIHGRQEVGLPSHVASFSHKVTTISNDACRPWWDATGWFTGRQKKVSKVQYSVEIVQRDGSSRSPLCEIVGIPRISSDSVYSDDRRWRGPSVQLCLPNFSGKTKEQPSLLKYTCALNCAVQLLAPASVIDLTSSSRAGGEVEEETRDVVAILTGKPLASIFFDKMVMHVEAPSVLVLKDSAQKHKKKTGQPTGNVGIAMPAVSSAAAS